MVVRTREEFRAVPSSPPCSVATGESQSLEELMDTLRNGSRSLLANTASISHKSLHEIRKPGRREASPAEHRE